MEGVHRIGRRVVHPGAGIQDQHAVPHPGCLAGNHFVDGKGKGPLGEHASQAIEDLDVHPLELPGPASDRRAPTPWSSGPPVGPASAPEYRPDGRARCGSEWRLPPRPHCPGARPGPAGAGPRASGRARPGPPGAASGWWWGAPGPARRTRTPALPGGRRAAGPRSKGRTASPSPRPGAAGGRRRVLPGRCARRRARRAWPRHYAQIRSPRRSRPGRS